MTTSIEGFGRSFAVLIGIDRYINGVPELSTPVDDAESLADVLRTDHGFRTKVLANEKATSFKLRWLLRALSRYVRPDDRVLFYFAGHGTVLQEDDGPQGYILPQDAETGSKERYLAMTDLDKALASLPCRHMLVVLDCCFAGALRWSNTRNLALRPENLHQERYDWYIQGSAWQAIASAAHDEKALDVAAGLQLGSRGKAGSHSPFAVALINGLKGAADLPRNDGPGDGVITATELFLYVEQQLMPSTATGRRSQTPILWPLPKHDKGQYVFLTPGHPLSLPPAPPLDPSTNPWRGAEPYGPSEARLFFGRKRVSEKLLARVLQDPIVVVTGPSSIGKSSLVQAGLLPRVPKPLRSIVVTLGQDPFADLASALLDVSPEGVHAPSKSLLETDPNALGDWAKALGEANAEILLVIDSADEIVSEKIVPNGPPSIINLISNALKPALQRRSADPHLKTEVEAAMQSLGYDRIGELSSDNDIWEALGTKDGEVVEATLGYPRLALRVVLTVRAERLARSPLADDWSQFHFVVPGMTQDELRRVIEGPATEAVMRFESDDLVDTLVNAVVQMPGALPILSRMLNAMYTLYLGQPADNRALTRGHYDKLKGVNGFVCDHAEKIFEGLDTEHRLTARRLLERMIEPVNLTRRQVAVREIQASQPAENERVAQVLNKLNAANLIVLDAVLDGNSHQDKGYVELAHIALAKDWETLQSWVREDSERIAALRRLTPEALVWTDSQKSELLWADVVRYGSIEMLLSTEYPGLNAFEKSFAQASRDRAESIRRRQRLVTIISVCSAIVFAVVAIAALVFQHIASENATLAKAQSARNRSLLLVSQSREVRGTNDQRALLLAVEAAKSTSEQGYVVPAARDALFDALRRVSGIALNGHEHGISIAAFSRDERFLATGAEDPSTAQQNEVRVWDISNPSAPLLAHIAQARYQFTHISFDRNSTHLLTVQKSSFPAPRNDALVWTLVDGELYPSSRPLFDNPVELGTLERSNNGELLAAATSFGSVMLVSLADLSETNVRRTLDVPDASSIERLVFSPDDAVLLACTASSKVLVWNLKSSSEDPVASIDAGHRADRPVTPEVGVDICGIDATHSMIFTASSDWFDNSTWADLNLKLWPLDKLKPVGDPLILSHKSVPNSSAIQLARFIEPERGIYSLSLDGWLRSWTLRRNGNKIEAAPSTELKTNEFLRSAAVSRDAAMLAYGLEHDVSIVPTKDLTTASANIKPSSLNGMDSAARVLEFSPNGRFLFVGSGDGKGRLWDFMNDMPAEISSKATPYGNSRASWLSDDGRIAIQLTDTELEFWDLKDPQHPALLRKWPVEAAHVATIVECLSCQVVVSQDISWASIQRVAQNESDIVELKEGGRSFVVPSRTWRLTEEIQFSDDGRCLFVEEKSKELIYKLKLSGTSQVKREIIDLPPGSYFRNISPDSRTVLYRKYVNSFHDKIGRAEEVGYILSLDSSGKLSKPRAVNGFAAGIGDVSFSQVGRWLAMADERNLDDSARTNYIVRLGRLDDAELQFVTLTGQEFAPRPTFSDNGKWLLTASYEMLLQGSRTLARLWRLDGRQPPKPFVLPNITTYLHRAEFSPDGRYLVTISGAGPLAQLWSLEDQPKLLAKLAIPRQTYNWHWTIRFNADSSTVAIFNDDNPIPYIWKIDGPSVPEAGIPIASGGKAIKDMRFTADGRKLVILTAGQTLDGRYGTAGSQVTIVDINALPNEDATYSLGVPSEELHGVHFRDDLKLLVTSSATALHLNSTDDEYLLRLARKVLGRNLSLDEWSQTKLQEVYRPTFPDAPVDAQTLGALVSLASRLRSDNVSASETLADDTVRWTLNLNDADVCNKIAWSFALEKDGRRALEAIACALAQRPKDPNYHDTRGVAYALLGDAAKAVSDLQLFVDSQDPNSAYATTRQRWIKDLLAGKDPFQEGVE
jgi:WD40 repeat protein